MNKFITQDRLTITCDITIFTAIVQEILVAGLSTYINQIIKQSEKEVSKIAAQYGTTYQRFAPLKGIKNPNKIYIGQKLRVK